MPAYLLCSRAPDCPADHPVAMRLREAAIIHGLSVRDLSATTWLAVAGPGRPQTRKVGAWTLIGEILDRRAPDVRRIPEDDPDAYEKKLVARFWGRFIGLRLDAKGCLSHLLRDPSGALDCIWWTQGPLTLVASDVPDWLAGIAGRGWRINVARVEAALHDPYSTSGDLLLDGPAALRPGAMTCIPDGPSVILWRPDWIVRSARAITDADAAAVLREAVDETLAGCIEREGGLAVEVSGGLDSSIVAASIAAQAPGRVKLWLNAWGPDETADERVWVEALAARIGVTATCVPRATGRLTPDLLEAFTLGVRPGLAALDGLHDADWADRLTKAGIETIVTGKGGDAMFVQPADPNVFIDLYRDAGWRALRSGALPALARWNERSVWSLVAAGRRGRWTAASPDPANPLLASPRACAGRHPWLNDIEDLGPAKRRQILGLVQGCGLHSASLQTLAASVLHPLLAQPVTEVCLALPAAQLTLGRRDRALARHAFADRLPAPLVARRTKGEMTAFYGHLIADSLDLLRPWLLEGRLAAMGLIDAARADAALSREALAWRGGYVDIMTTAAIEGWVRTWERRLDGN